MSYRRTSAENEILESLHSADGRDILDALPAEAFYSPGCGRAEASSRSSLAPAAARGRERPATSA